MYLFRFVTKYNNLFSITSIMGDPFPSAMDSPHTFNREDIVWWTIGKYVIVL